MADIQIYTKGWCPYCTRAKALLKAKGLSFRETDVTADPVAEQDMIARSGLRTVPQIFIDGASIGGFVALASLNASGELDRHPGLPTGE